MKFSCTCPPTLPAFSQTEAAFHDLLVICVHCYHSTTVFFLLTPLELASPESMARPGGEGLVYSNEPSVGLHLWTTQERQRAVARLGSGAHLCSLTCLGFPFLSGLLQSHHAPHNLALRDLISLSLLPSPPKISGGVDFICLHRECSWCECGRLCWEPWELPCQFASSKRLAQDVFYFNFYVCT